MAKSLDTYSPILICLPSSWGASWYQHGGHWPEILIKQARKPRSYASPKLCPPTNRPTDGGEVVELLAWLKTGVSFVLLWLWLQFAEREAGSQDDWCVWDSQGIPPKVWPDQVLPCILSLKFCSTLSGSRPTISQMVWYSFQLSALTLSPGCPASTTNSQHSSSWWDF